MLEVVGFQRRGACGLCPLCQAGHAEFTQVEALMDQVVLHHRHEDFGKANFLAEVLSVDPLLDRQHAGESVVCSGLVLSKKALLACAQVRRRVSHM